MFLSLLGEETLSSTLPTEFLFHFLGQSDPTSNFNPIYMEIKLQSSLVKD